MTSTPEWDYVNLYHVELGLSIPGLGILLYTTGWYST